MLGNFQGGYMRAVIDCQDMFHKDMWYYTTENKRKYIYNKKDFTNIVNFFKDNIEAMCTWGSEIDFALCRGGSFRMISKPDSQPYTDFVEDYKVALDELLTVTKYSHKAIQEKLKEMEKCFMR